MRLAEDVVTAGNGDGSKTLDVTVNRSPPHKGVKIFLPRVLHSDGNGKFRLIDYHRDILGELDWDSFSFAKDFDAGEGKLEGTVVKIDIDKKDGQFELSLSKKIQIDTPPEELDFPFMVRQLMDVVPNPWQAARIMEETLEGLEEKVSKKKLYANRLVLLELIRRNLQKQVNEASETLFREKLKKGNITFRLVSPADSQLNWDLAETLHLKVLDTDKKLRKKNADNLERPLFEAVYERDLNSLEKNVALHLDGKEMVKWWHRMVAKQDYHLQGWQRNRVYPDFLVALTDLPDGTRRIEVLETKGSHLKGNDDTTYKAKLFDLLSKFHNKGMDAGEFEVIEGQDQRIIFKMLMEDCWQENLASAGRS